MHSTSVFLADLHILGSGESKKHKISIVCGCSLVSKDVCLLVFGDNSMMGNWKIYRKIGGQSLWRHFPQKNVTTGRAYFQGSFLNKRREKFNANDKTSYDGINISLVRLMTQCFMNFINQALLFKCNAHIKKKVD